MLEDAELVTGRETFEVSRIEKQWAVGPQEKHYRRCVRAVGKAQHMPDFMDSSYEQVSI